MKTRKLLWTVPLLGMLAMPAIAHDYHNHNRFENRFEQRLDRQHARIKQGVRSGELTRKEAKLLRRQQRGIRQLLREFRDDGWLSKKERRILTKKLDRASRRIWEYKHNEFTRHRHRYGYGWDEPRRYRYYNDERI